MSEKSTLRIHAQIMPEDTQTASVGTEKKAKTIRWKSVPIPKAEKAERKRSQTAAKAHRPRARLGFSDRLLRNSSIACAILLGILALGNINQPWAEKATAGIEQALKIHTTPNREIRSTMISRGQSKYFIRLLSKRLSFMYLKKAAIFENI